MSPNLELLVERGVADTVFTAQLRYWLPASACFRMAIGKAGRFYVETSIS